MKGGAICRGHVKRPPRLPASTSALPFRFSGSRISTSAWRTTNIDELYAELDGRGAHLRHPPTNYPWDSRECQVTDPDGHVLRFGAESKPDDPIGDWLDGKDRLWRPQADGSWRLVE